MILILISLIAVTALCCFVAVYGGINSFFSGLVAPMVGVIGFVCLIGYSFAAFGYIAAEHKAKIINREYGTNYTQEEVFYAADVIDAVRQLDRKRIEIDGNLITGK